MVKKKSKWGSGDLSDSDFVQLSEMYFDRQKWDLPTAICLWAKIDPHSKKLLFENKDPDFYASGLIEDEVLDRYLKLSLEAIQCADEAMAEANKIVRLPYLIFPSQLTSYKEIILNPRRFVFWLEKKYEGGVPHMTKAEAAYQVRKASRKIKKEVWVNPKENADKHAEISRVEFLSMVEEEEIDLTKKGIVASLAIRLHERLCEKIDNPYKPNTLRSKAMIPTWINEYLPKQYLSQK